MNRKSGLRVEFLGAKGIYFLKRSDELQIAEFQKHIAETFGQKDQKRGVSGTFMWFMEEIGELAEALRELEQSTNADRGNQIKALGYEFADVFAWLVTLANVAKIDLQAMVHEKYGLGCPKCSAIPCVCSQQTKP